MPTYLSNRFGSPTAMFAVLSVILGALLPCAARASGHWETRHIDGYWEAIHHDGYWDAHFVDGYWERISHPGYWSTAPDGSGGTYQVWNPESAEFVWVDGYWSYEWVDGYDEQVWVDGYYETFWVNDGGPEIP